MRIHADGPRLGPEPRRTVFSLTQCGLASAELILREALRGQSKPGPHRGPRTYHRSLVAPRSRAERKSVRHHSGAGQCSGPDLLTRPDLAVRARLSVASILRKIPDFQQPCGFHPG